MTRPYHVIEVTPGQYHVRAGETTADSGKARQYASPEGAARGLGMARKWDLLPNAKIVPMTPSDASDASDATDAEPSQ